MTSFEFSFQVEATTSWIPETNAPLLSAINNKQISSHSNPTQPDISFIPAIVRRRLSLLSKMLLYVAQHCLAQSKSSQVQAIFASRHGEIQRTMELLKSILADQMPSPSGFGHSVHNTALGLFSIHYQNHLPCTAISAGRHSLIAAFIEAASRLQSEPQTPILLIMADEALPSIFSKFADEWPSAYAIAFLLSPYHEHKTHKLFPHAPLDPTSPVDALTTPTTPPYYTLKLSASAHCDSNDQITPSTSDQTATSELKDHLLNQDSSDKVTSTTADNLPEAIKFWQWLHADSQTPFYCGPQQQWCWSKYVRSA